MPFNHKKLLDSQEEVDNFSWSMLFNVPVSTLSTDILYCVITEAVFKSEVMATVLYTRW